MVSAGITPMEAVDALAELICVTDGWTDKRVAIWTRDVTEHCTDITAVTQATHELTIGLMSTKPPGFGAWLEAYRAVLARRPPPQRAVGGPRGPIVDPAVYLESLATRALLDSESARLADDWRKLHARMGIPERWAKALGLNTARRWPCPPCESTGWVRNPQGGPCPAKCPRCDGTGVIIDMATSDV
jgi:hypothetical protein